jgi:hypothetical protein
MGFPGAHNVRRRPQGLGVARDVSAPRIGVLPFLTHDREPVPTSRSVSGTPYPGEHLPCQIRVMIVRSCQRRGRSSWQQGDRLGVVGLDDC